MCTILEVIYSVAFPNFMASAILLGVHWISSGSLIWFPIYHSWSCWHGWKNKHSRSLHTLSSTHCNVICWHSIYNVIVRFYNKPGWLLCSTDLHNYIKPVYRNKNLWCNHTIDFLSLMHRQSIEQVNNTPTVTVCYTATLTPEDHTVPGLWSRCGQDCVMFFHCYGYWT